MKHSRKHDPAPDDQDPQPRRSPGVQDAEVARARELLDRTVRFLSRCVDNPEGAMSSDDPRELIRGLESLTVEPTPAEPPQQPERHPEPRTIQIRRRRSA